MIKPAYINNLASIHSNGMDEEQTYLQASEPDYKELIPNATLRRRMSHVVRMGVACGMECIGNTPKEDIQAIITATGLGCMADTEKFMNNLLDNNEQLLNPTSFIQSTFNTVGAQIALLCRNQAYNVAYVHRGFSFESALLDGLLRIQEGDRNVLVGAFDEITETSYTIQKRMGLLKDTYAGEGAQFFLLSKERSDRTFARIHAPETFTTSASQEVINHIDRYLSLHGLNLNDIAWFVSGDQDVSVGNLFPKAMHRTFKDACGEYPTASAYAVWQTAKEIREVSVSGRGRYALIYNCYHTTNHSLILLSEL